MATVPSTTLPPGKQRTSARERLLEAADELFYSEGINNVGIDRVIEHAGVAKASLYAHFASKDELVRAYLETRHQARKVRIEQRLARHRSPRERLLSLFDGIAESAARPGYRGCAFVRADAEQVGGEAARAVSETARGWLRELFVSLVREAGARNPAALAQQLVLLYDGATVSAQMDGSPAAALSARSLAASLLDAATASKSRSTR
jgi:AcrR family transcriptional regulator